MANEAKKPSFVQFDTAFAGDKKLTKLYATMKETYSLYATAKKEFEDEFRAKAVKAEIVDDDHEMLISHKFGKLSIAIVEKGERRTVAKTAKKALSF